MEVAKKWEITITNADDSSVLWNRMKKEVQDEIKGLKKNELAAWEIKEENWMKKGEWNNGDAIMPWSWLRKSLINACKRSRHIPHFATRKNETWTAYMESCRVLNSPVIGKVKDIESYGCYQPIGQGRIWKVYPMLKKWSATFSFIDPGGMLTEEDLKYLLEYDGAFVGVGDSRKWGFGRFNVVSIKEVK